MPADVDVLLREGKLLPRGYTNLQVDQIQSRDQFGHWMLHLQARVHFQEIEVLVAVHKKLDGPRIAVLGSLGRAHRDFTHAAAHIWIDKFRRRLFQHFLMTPLNGALAFSEIHNIAVLIRQHLHLDMPWSENCFLQIDFTVAEGPLRLTLCCL